MIREGEAWKGMIGEGFFKPRNIGNGERERKVERRNGNV